MVDLTDLIARVEAASGPDRELDGAVYAALGYEVKIGPVHPRTNPRVKSCLYRNRARRHWKECRHLTASLDAVMTLMPEGVEYDCTNLYGVAHADVGLNLDAPCSGRREDGNLILALLSAILQARHAMEARG